MVDCSSFLTGSGYDYGGGGGGESANQQSEGQNPGDTGEPNGLPICPYTMQGVLQFLQTEWNKFESDRINWEVERVELEASINFLRGERNGQENLKHDLIRRIKMLELALKEERVRYHQLQSRIGDGESTASTNHHQPAVNGVGDPIPSGERPGQPNPGDLITACTEKAMESSAKWRESRMRLTQFLKEVNSTENVLNLRQSRVLKQLLSKPDAVRRRLAQAENFKEPGDIRDENNQRVDVDGRDNSRQLDDDDEDGIRGVLDEEFWNSRMPDNLDEMSSDRRSAASDQQQQPVPGNRFRRVGGAKQQQLSKRQELASMKDRLDAKLASEGKTCSSKEDFINLANKLSEATFQGHPDDLTGQHQQASTAQDSASDSFLPALGVLANIGVQNDAAELQGDSAAAALGSGGGGGGGGMHSSTGNLHHTIEALLSEPSTIDSSARGGGGGLADDHVGDIDRVAALAGPSSAPGGPQKLAYSWIQRFQLRGHWDSVRSVAFHRSEPMLFTGGEDGLVMLWAFDKDITKYVPASTLPLDDLEPIHVYSGHTSPVLCLAAPPHIIYDSISQEQRDFLSRVFVFSAGLDGTIRTWYPPPSSSSSPSSSKATSFDLYAPSPVVADESTAGPVFKGAPSAIWSIDFHPSKPLIVGLHANAKIDFWALLPNESSQATSTNSVKPLHCIDLLTLTSSPNAPRPSVTLTSILIGRPTCFSLRNMSSNSCFIVTTSKGWVLLIDSDLSSSQPLIDAVRLPLPDGTTSAGDQLTGSATSKVEDTNATSDDDGDLWMPDGIVSLAVSSRTPCVYTGHVNSTLTRFELTPPASYGGSAADGIHHHLVPLGEVKAHVDAVTALTLDSNEVTLLSASHDGSVRVWNSFDLRCLQDFMHHRVKNDEAIHCLSHHPSLPFMASAGADSTVRIYASLPSTLASPGANAGAAAESKVPGQQRSAYNAFQ